jgi:hypothetical protein
LTPTPKGRRQSSPAVQGMKVTEEREIGVSQA